MTDFTAALTAEADVLTGRLTTMLGDPHRAEDLRQETFERALRHAPRDAGRPVLRAWLHRTARNLAIDELRRRARRPAAALEEDLLPGGAADPDGGREAREALALLSAHQRMLLLLRFEAGLSLRELGELLDLGEDAARKRVARARSAFADALRAVRADDERPSVTVLVGRDDPAPYRAWLMAAGARVRMLDRVAPLDLAGADALVLTGSTRDIHPRLYGAPTRAETVDPDLTGDLRDALALRAALAEDLPVVGVCRGVQLLNVLFGGDLSQHVDGHDTGERHPLDVLRGSAVHRALGPRPEIVSDHHQGVRRVGRGLRVTATAPDGLVEAVEVPGRRLALGTQWHPERGGGAGLAALLVDAAAAVRAA